MNIYEIARARHNALADAYNAGRAAAQEDIRRGDCDAEGAQERHGGTMEERREVNAGYWDVMRETDDKFTK